MKIRFGAIFRLPAAKLSVSLVGPCGDVPVLFPGVPSLLIFHQQETQISGFYSTLPVGGANGAFST